MRIIALLLSLLAFSVKADITVVTSITPLYQITRTIMEGVGEPELLIKNQASAHHFAFKPSHFRLLEKADVFIWIDRYFESGLQRVPDILRHQTRSLELLPALDLNGQDGHIWYSPSLLVQIIEAIRAALSAADPANADSYHRNASKMVSQIKNWAQEIRQQLGVSKPVYLLDHDFLHHFESDFGIQAISSLHNSNDQQVGIGELQRIEQQLTRTPAKCLLTNEASPSKIAANMARKFNLKLHHISPTTNKQGRALSFIESLRELSQTLVNCR